MDPVTAVGLVANILQFVELGCKIFANAKEIRQSAAGLTLNDQRTVDLMSEMRRLSSNLEITGKTPSDANEKALHKLASECRKLSHEILELLKKTSAKNPGSIGEAIRSTVRGMRYAREKEELEQKLNVCRSQLHLHLDYVSGSNIKDQLMSLATDNKTQLSTINDLDASLKRLHGRLFSLCSSNNDLMEKIRELVQLPQAAREAVAQQQILRMLDHDDFHLRYDIVDEAHQETFRWIVEEGNNADSEHLSSSRKLLRTWLAQEQGVFHITGKLGSGKSTLMKFLSSHPNTISDLQIWSGTRRLAFVNFFFWRPGSTWQNSVRGLLRGLVHAILQSCPELIQVAFPDIWKNIVQPCTDPFDSNQRDRHSIVNKVIQTALGHILTNANVHKTHRFCFFIDALDEQNDPSPQNDHKALVEMIQSWLESSKGALKVCVSSREDNVFINAFNLDRRLRLQDLTRQDLEKYVDQKLPDLPSTDMRKRISTTIVERSCGIFLWVVLVVKSLREAFEDGRKLSDFEAELSSLPSELEALFTYLLRTIPTSRRRNAYCLFKLMTLPDRVDIPLHGVLYLDKYLKNPRFALEDGPSQPKVDQYPHSKDSSQEDMELVKARKMLQGDCRGLVESPGVMPSYTTFTHRSVPEFLEKSATKEVMNSETSGFVPAEALAQMLLGRIRATDETRTEIDPEDGNETPRYIVDVLWVYYGAERRQYDPTNEYLTTLEKELQRKGLALPVPYTHGFLRFVNTGPIYPPEVYIAERSGKSTIITHPSYLLALLGDLDYVEWKLEQDPLFMAHAGNRSLLLACMYYGLMFENRNWSACPQSVEIVRQLLGMGPVDSLKDILALLITRLGRWQSHSPDEFMESKQVFGTSFAALLGKVEEENPVAITFTIKDGPLSVYWNGVDLSHGSFSWAIETESELAKRFGDDHFNLREFIEFLDFENGDEILALIDKLEAPAGSSSGLDQTADTSRTFTSHTQMPNLSLDLDAGPLEEDASTECENPKEEAAEDGAKIADDCEGTAGQAPRSQLPNTLPGAWAAYLLFALLGILCAFVIYRVLSG